MKKIIVVFLTLLTGASLFAAARMVVGESFTNTS
jgi:hypothetical protein